MKLPRPLLFLLLTLLPTPTHSTTLSTDNCPSNFNLGTANITADSSLTPMVSLIYAKLYSESEQAKIQASLASGNSTEIDNKVFTLSMLAPFAIIAAAFLITFVVASCCCIFPKTCPPCRSWQRNFVTRPYQKTELRCLMIFTLIFALGIAITAIIAFIYFPKLQQQIQNTKCGLYMSLDVALNGDQDNNWGGFTLLSHQIGNISSLLSTASTEVTTTLSNNQWLVDDMAALKQQNLNIYKNNNQSTVYSPNPVTTQISITGNTDLPTVTPLFIAQDLGPNSTAGTMVNDIDAGIRITENVSTQGYRVYQAALLLANSANTITANLNLALNAMTLNANYLTSIKVSVDKFSASLFDSVFNWGLYFIQGILGFILAASLLIILGVVASHWFQLYGCTTSVHLGWVAYGITYFGIVVLTFIFFSFGGISYQFCQFYGGLVTDSTSFSAYAQVTGKSEFSRFFQKINTCFYSNGNIMDSFSISQESQTVSGLYSQIGSFQSMRDLSSTNYVDTAASPSKITNWMAAMEQYRMGIYIDSSVNNEDNPEIALTGLNKYTSNRTGGTPPSCANDYWVFDTANCTQNATEAIYLVDAMTSGVSFASSGTTCISFNQKFQSTTSYSWTISDVARRYVARRQCESNTQSYDMIINYATSLINYRDSRINLYQNLKDQLDALLTSNNNFNTKLATYTTDVSSFVTNTQTLNTLVTNAVNGLDASGDCRTLANHLRFVNNVFCKNFLYTSVQFGICCLVLLGIMIGGTITGAVFAIRYGRVEKDTRTVRPEINSLQSLNSDTFEHRKNEQVFDRKEQNSSSSSSDDD